MHTALTPDGGRVSDFIAAYDAKYGKFNRIGNRTP